MLKRITLILVTLIAAFVGVTAGLYVSIPDAARAQTNTFCAANIACTVTAAWNYTGGLSSTQFNGCQYVNANQTLPQAITAAGSTGCIVVSINYIMAASATIPVGVPLIIRESGGLTTTGFTLTINGAFQAPPAQAFFGTGTVTFTNSNTTGPLQSIWFPGADTCARITNAQAALPATGGIVDARTEAPGSVGCASSFSVGSGTQQVQLLLGNNTLAVPATVNMGQGSEIKGLGTNGTAQSNIQAQNGFSPAGPLIQWSNTVGADAIRIRDVRLDAHQVTNVNVVLDTGGAQDQSAIDSVLLFNWTTKCINIGASSQQVRLDNFTCQAATNASGANGITIASGSNHIYLRDFGVGSQSAGQQTAGVVCTSCDVEIVGAHFENMLSAILLTGGGNGTAFISGINGLSNDTHMVNIASSWTGSAAIFSVRKNTAAHAITNNIAFANSFCDDESVGFYILSSTSSSPQQVATNCSSGGGAAYGALGIKTNALNVDVVKNSTGTAQMGMTLKKGSGGGNYTNATTSYTVADSTNLCFTVTIPTGWKLGISASGALSTATAAVVAQAALTDNAACSTANAGVLVETAPIQGAGISVADAFALNWVITGDGASHNIAMQFKTSNAADTASLINSSATQLPTMKFELMPSN